ncbi:MAG: hypothetical protein MK078_10525, partial [Crocinitomicaceae bacterium]|nr:hypothetical protein [Crocinitomicaceae bacterium]
MNNLQDLKMNSMLGMITIVLFLFSCSNEESSIDIYCNNSLDFDTQVVDHSDFDFTIDIPANWIWKVEDYQNENFIMVMNASSKPDKNGYIDMIAIQKVKSLGGNEDLESEFNYLLSISKEQTEYHLVIAGSGKTNILKYDSYFIHTKPQTGMKGALESIEFILESKSKGTFYYL